MNALRPAVLIFLILSSVAAVMAGPASSSYSESYAIMVKGALAGSETVTEKPDASGNIVSSSDHEMLVQEGLEKKSMRFSTKMTFSKKTGIPSSYSYWYTSGTTGDSYEVTINNGQITRVLNRGGRSNDVTVALEPDMVFVDFNVYHQYDYLIRKYDLKKGGRQTFSDFIPLIGNDIPVAVTFLGESKMTLQTGGSMDVRNFRVEFVGIWGGTLTATKEGRLVRLVISSQDLEVIRRDLLVP